MPEITPAQIQAIIPRTPPDVAARIAQFFAVAGEGHPYEMAAFIGNVAFETVGFSARGLSWQLQLLWDRWTEARCAAFARIGDFRTVVRAFSRDLVGYGARLLIYKRALRVLGAPMHALLMEKECQ